MQKHFIQSFGLDSRPKECQEWQIACNLSHLSFHSNAWAAQLPQLIHKVVGESHNFFTSLLSTSQGALIAIAHLCARTVLQKMWHGLYCTYYASPMPPKKVFKCEVLISPLLGAQFSVRYLFCQNMSYGVIQLHDSPY